MQCADAEQWVRGACGRWGSQSCAQIRRFESSGVSLMPEGLEAGLTPADLRAFLTRRRMEGLGNSSAARELSALRGFIAFAAAEAGEGAVPRLRGPKRPRSVPRAAGRTVSRDGTSTAGCCPN